jgi:hyperosmotically inducible periplasmic protein
MNQRLLTISTVGALMASMALVGCNRRDEQGARNSTDQAVASVQKSARDAESSTSNMMDRAKNATENATTKVGDKVSDAAITSSVKTELAKDSKLSALKINVDTDNGKVALKGVAPSNEAREHATTLAQNVKGVTSVDNQLTVEPKS